MADPKNTGGRMPPHNLEMERVVLGACLINPNGFGQVVNVVKADGFYSRRHRLIFKAMERLFASGSPIDFRTVNEELRHSDDLIAAGNSVYLIGLSKEVATAAHVEHYATIIAEQYALRQLIVSTTKVALEAYEKTADAAGLIDEAMQELFNIYATNQRGGFEPIAPILGRLHEHLDKLHKRGDEGLTGVGSGFDSLDNMTSGFQPGDLVILAGRPSMGKTALALDFARAACLQHNTPVGFFSLEMASLAIVMRLVAAVTKVELYKLRSGKVPAKQVANLSKATTTLSQMKFFIDDTGSLGMMELRARARMLKQKHNIGILFIDYLQLMQPPKADSREQEVARISRGLKALARELEIPVVALSQLSRAVESRGGEKKPQLADLRDSGAIEQDADVVMFVWRPAQYKDKEEKFEELDQSTSLLIRKQRNGPTGTVNLTFLPEIASFVEQSDKRSTEMADSHTEQDTTKDDGTPF
ncbi:MAG: replicative DNA helicase [Candidatus Electryoneaceae bacterium]|nr:replicative DNA helicase [Candidatus Electryoneaceae bacterium]